MTALTRAALCAAVLLCATPALAQSDCKAFVGGLTGKNKAIDTAMQALGKMRPGPSACAEARKVSDAAKKLLRDIDAGAPACASLPENDMARVTLRFDRASASSSVTFVEGDVDRLCNCAI